MLNQSNRLLIKFREKMKTYCTECKFKLENSSFLLSFSGGMDSSVMASIMVEMRKIYNIKLGFAHINHHAHFKSEMMEEFCYNYSHDNNILYYCLKLSLDSHRNFEACAREKRYKFLKEIAKQDSYHFILTAHHQDDQLETLYMKIMDGGDWISQIGIRERMGKLRRPFLDIPKNEIEQYAKQQHISYIQDPTNTDISIRRNNIRHKHLPLAIQADSRLKDSLLKTSRKNAIKMKKTKMKLIKDQVNLIKNNSTNKIQIDREALQNYNLEEVKIFIYKSIASLLNINLNHQSGGLWREFKAFIHKSNTGAIFQIDTITFIINRNEIVAINHYDNFKTPDKICLSNNLLWYSGIFKTINNNKVELSLSKNKFTVPHSLYQAGLFIRPWRHGDRMVSATSKKNLLLSDLYINNKLSKYEKLIQPVVVDDQDIIYWIPGLLHGEINYNKLEKVKVIHWTQK